MSSHNRLEDSQQSTGLKLDSLKSRWIDGYKYHQTLYPGYGIDSNQMVLSSGGTAKASQDDTYIGSLLDIKCTTTTELSRDLAAAIGKEFPGKLYTDA